MDNSTSDSSEFDFELLQADFDAETLNDWGLDVDFEVEEEENEPEELTVQKKLLKCTFHVRFCTVMHFGGSICGGIGMMIVSICL